MPARLIRVIASTVAIVVVLGATAALAAVAPPGGGITQGIPEPTGAALFALGAALAVRTLRRTRR